MYKAMSPPAEPIHQYYSRTEGITAAKLLIVAPDKLAQKHTPEQTYYTKSYKTCAHVCTTKQLCVCARVCVCMHMRCCCMDSIEQEMQSVFARIIIPVQYNESMVASQGSVSNTLSRECNINVITCSTQPVTRAANVVFCPKKCFVFSVSKRMTEGALVK